MTAAPVYEAGALLAVSQSGETKDVHRAVKIGEEMGVPCISVVNVVGSLIARATGLGVYLNAGRENAVASTKAFTCQVVVLLMMALKLGRGRRFSREEGIRIAREIENLPALVARVIQQDQRSQHKNRDKAMQVLRTRLYELERERLASERSGARKSMVGSGDRSERIRTYNFPQGRVTDHRINLTLYKLPQVIAGEALGELIDALTTEHQAAQLAAQGAAA